MTPKDGRRLEDNVPGLADLRAGGRRARLWRRYWLADPANGAVDLALHYGLRLAGVDGCSAAGAALGRRLVPHNHPDWECRADAALQHLRPELREADRADLRRRRCAELGRLMAEFGVLHRIVAQDRVAIVGAERLHEALACPEPLILAAVHLSNWEIGGCPSLLARLAGFGGPVPELCWIYQPPRSRFRHALAVRARRRMGVTLLPPGRRAGTAAMRALKGGGRLWMAVDDYRGRQVHGPLFGRPPDKSANLGIAVRLAAATGAHVLPIYVVRREGAHFTLHVAPPPFDWPARLAEARAGDTAPAIHALNARVQPPVLAHLDQWFMLHELRLGA